MVQGRCMKCKKQVEIVNAQEVVTKNGMKMLKGTCGEDGKTTVCKIIGKA